MPRRPYPRSIAAFAAILCVITILTSPTLAGTNPQRPVSDRQPVATSTGSGKSSSTALAAPISTAIPTPLSKPWFVVFVRANQGDKPKPVYDGKDLELYFSNQLNAERINAVVPFSTARIPKPATPDVYLLELTVDALSTSHRTRRDWQGNYVDDPFVRVELSLKVWHIASQKLIGETGERREYHIEDPENAERQRARLYETADHLADRFIAETAAGHFGEGLRWIQRPMTWDDLSTKEKVSGFIVAGIIGVLVALIIIKLLCFIKGLLRRFFRAGNPPKNSGTRAQEPLPPIAPVVMLPSPAQLLALPEPAASTEPPREWEDRIKNAIALSLSTGDFSDPACLAIARHQRDEILKDARKYEDAEAARLLRAKDRMEEDRKAAAEWAKHSDLSETEILNVLQNADIWDYRLLLAAKALAHEGRN